MTRDYVEQRDGGYYVAGARVSLDSIVYAFRGGESPETIQQSFPSLTLEQVYGAITFYLGVLCHSDFFTQRQEPGKTRTSMSPFVFPLALPVVSKTQSIPI